MNKNSVKQRIFLSNTLMMFALLAIFLLINLAVIKIYGESIEHQFVNNASAFLTETEWKNFLKTWTIRQNQFILLFILDGVVCIFVLVAISQFFTKNLVKHIMQPLEALNQGAQRVQENDLTQDIQNEGDREFETVCSTFNAMQKHILNEQEKNHKYEKARMDMLRGISHDLKTPLTAIQGSIKGILDGVVTTPDMQDKFLSAAYRRTKEMDGLLNQLFYLSALETGSLPMHFQAVELKEFLQTYVKMRQAECDDVVFCLDLPKQAFVRIDCHQMERVLDNVIENSKKYSGKSKVQISIGLKACFDCCYVSIADDGVGLDESKLPYVFNQFYRGDPSRSQPVGNGIGLYVVKYLVEAMHGSVRAYNQNGFVIEIQLPKQIKKEV